MSALAAMTIPQPEGWDGRTGRKPGGAGRGKLLGVNWNEDDYATIMPAIQDGKETQDQGKYQEDQGKYQDEDSSKGTKRSGGSGGSGGSGDGEGDQEEPEKKDRLLSPLKLGAGALAAVTAALLGSLLGDNGTLIGVAFASVVSGAGATLYEHGARRAADKARAARGKTLLGDPAARRGHASAGTAGRGAARRVRKPSLWEGIKLGASHISAKVVLLALGFTVLVAGGAYAGVTVTELVTGNTLHGITTGTVDHGTTLGGGARYVPPPVVHKHKHHHRKHHVQVSPSPSPSITISPTGTPSPSASVVPSVFPSISPTVTPSAAGGTPTVSPGPSRSFGPGAGPGAGIPAR